MMSICTKRKREQLLRLRILRYWGKPNIPKRVKAHAIRREPSTSVLECCSFNSPIVRIQESKRTLQCICLLISISVHRQFQFLGFNNIVILGLEQTEEFFQLQNKDFWEINIFQHIVVFVVRDNISGVSSKGTIHKLVVVMVCLYQL